MPQAAEALRLIWRPLDEVPGVCRPSEAPNHLRSGGLQTLIYPVRP